MTIDPDFQSELHIYILLTGIQSPLTYRGPVSSVTYIPVAWAHDPLQGMWDSIEAAQRIPVTEVHGSVGRDVFHGGNEIDAFYGGRSNDVLYGGGGNDWLYGGAGDDKLYGGNGSDRLYGGPGHDVLTGGAGRDLFLFEAQRPKAVNSDRIVDFRPGQDHFQLDFLPQASEASSYFWKNTTGHAHDADDRIVYETDTGWLNYDSNGSLPGGEVHMAKLAPHLAITANDFV